MPGGPPAHWVAMLRERAPHLLEPGAMSIHSSSWQRLERDSHGPATGCSEHPADTSETPHTVPVEFSPPRVAGEPCVTTVPAAPEPEKPKGSNPPVSWFSRRDVSRAQHAVEGHQFGPVPAPVSRPRIGDPLLQGEPPDPHGSERRIAPQRSGILRFFSSSNRQGARQTSISYQATSLRSVETVMTGEPPPAGRIAKAPSTPASALNEDVRVPYSSVSQPEPVSGATRGTFRADLAYAPGPEVKPVGAVHSLDDESSCQPLHGVSKTSDWQSQHDASQLLTRSVSDRHVTYPAQTSPWPAPPDEPDDWTETHFNRERVGSRDPAPKRDNLSRVAHEFKLHCEQQGVAWNGFPF